MREISLILLKIVTNIDVSPLEISDDDRKSFITNILFDFRSKFCKTKVTLNELVKLRRNSATLLTFCYNKYK